jgi:hypothetical protein
MSDFEKRIPDEAAMIDEWPDPNDDYELEDEDFEDEEPVDYVVKFTIRAATGDEVSDISKYLFELLAKELDIPYDKFEDLEIEED